MTPKELLTIYKNFAVIGVTPDKSKYGYKIYKRLKEKGYHTFGVSPKYQEINDMIHSSIDRGTTYLKIKTGFLNNDQQMVMTVVQSRELKRVEKLVHEIDPTAFMVISKVKEVKGRGFGLDKSYLKKYADNIEK